MPLCSVVVVALQNGGIAPEGDPAGGRHLGDLCRDVGGRFPETDAHDVLTAERLGCSVMHRMLDLTSELVGALELRNAGDVHGMRAGADGYGVAFGDRDRPRLRVAILDLKYILCAAPNCHNLGIELDVRKQP